MKNLLYKYFFISTILFVAGCIGLEPITLETRNDTPIYKPSGFSYERLKDGILYDFRGGIGEWWSSSEIKLMKRGSEMKITSNGAGPNYELFGRSFDPLDFRSAPVLRLRVKLDDKTEDLPDLRIDLKDVNDNQTNGSPVVNTIKKGDYAYYYFDFNHKFTQTYPSDAKVDQSAIAGIQMFINPGGEPYYGTFYIDEIYVMANKDGSGIVSTDIVIDDFNGDVGMWWPCKKEKVSVSKDDSLNALRVHINDGQWDCFGRVFGEVDITENPIIKITARAESNDPVKYTNIMARFIDVNENSTDLIDGQNMIEMEVGGAGYKDYYSVFKDDRENNLYSSQGDFDPKRVNRVIIFINMNRESNFTGDVIVKEVSFVQELPLEEEEKRGNLWGAKPGLEPEWPKGEVYSLIDDFNSVQGWKSTSSNLEIVNAQGIMELNCSKVGSGYEYVEKEIKPLDFYDSEYLKITARAAMIGQNENPAIRIDMVDNFGTVTNARPQEVTIERGTELDEYYIKLKNNFYQRNPEMKVVNAGSINKIRIYVEPGKKNYTGKVFIDKIEAVSIDQLPEEWFSKLKEL